MNLRAIFGLSITAIISLGAVAAMAADANEFMGDQSFAATRVMHFDVELPAAAFNDVLKPEFRRELGIRDDQAQKITEARNELSKAARVPRGGGPRLRTREVMDEARRQRAEALAAYPKKVMAILSPDQRQRLFELYLQRGGYSLVTDVYIAKRLGVTPEQQQGVEKCRLEFQEGGRKLFELARTDREAMQKQLKELQEEYSRKVGDVLTAEQRALFREMQGAPFELPSDGGGRE